MSRLKIIQERMRIPALLLAVLSLFALGGCKGMSDAPFGSTITVEVFGVPLLSNMTITAAASKTQRYRVVVLDAAGLPLNDIDVSFTGQFSNGQSIDFGGSIGSTPSTGTVALSTTGKTDAFGYLDFAITAPYYAIAPIHYPYNQTANVSTTGGNLADGNYFYTVTALDFAGETDFSTPITAIVSNTTPTIPASSVALSWQAVPGATSYRIYRGTTAGTLRLLVTILNPSGDPLTFTDVGNITTATSPPFVNSTGLSLNSVIGQAQATTGAAAATFTINF